MNLRLEIAPETERRLRARAHDEGLTPEAFVQMLLDDNLAVDRRPASASGAATGSEASGPSPLQSASDEEDLPTPWRGVFATEHRHETLFTQDLIVPLAGLPRREPNVIVNSRWLDDEE